MSFLGSIKSVIVGDVVNRLGLTDSFPDLTEYGFPSYGGYRPRQWGGGGLFPEMVYCHTNVGGLFFDAVITVDTEHSATITNHPVQWGANISDHMYVNPVTITMEIGMSDAMASMVGGQWSGRDTKSVSAYQKLVDLMEAREPFSVWTRLKHYPNMVIESLSVNDDSTTLYGLRASVTMKQIIMACVATEKVSAREWTSGSEVNKGEVQPVEPPKSVIRSVEDIAKG